MNVECYNECWSKIPSNFYFVDNVSENVKTKKKKKKKNYDKKWLLTTFLN